MKIPLTAASFVYAAGNEQPQKNELKPGYEMLYYIAQQRDWEAAEIVFAYFLAALESDADKQAFTKLYEENHIHMEQAAMRILKDQTDAEDAMLNAFVQIIRHFEEIYKIPCDKLHFWCVSIVKNEALTILRKKKRLVFLDDLPNKEIEAEAVTNYADLVQLFAKLPDTYRAVLEMKVLMGYSEKEIAQHLGISPSAVGTRIFRGKVFLREIIGKEGFEL